ncbi:monocarboxylate transporter 1-like [Vespa mandarinia]|uniref:monocarboxylate transporter 1-like n=1 Tax=Vespa mandarinia TaxID=7446 RepID=UPI00162043A3|nr:monocarboxylate transporter 1-like [Vespa mandarinia]
MTMQRVQDQDNGINIKFGSKKSRKGDYKLVSQDAKKERQNNYNGTNKHVKDVTPEEELVPPDGGWGWLVLLASVLVNVLIPGMVKSFGVLFVEFRKVFDASPAAAAWIPALCYFLYSSLGPLSSVLSVKYSYRTVSLLGGTSAAVGMMISYFANSVGFLCVSFGVLVGTGAGLAFPPTVYIVTSYFVRLRGLANGLCISGSALGSIFLPPLLGLLLQEYGYRGAVLIMGAMTLNVWACALLYDPVEKHMIPARPSRDSKDHKSLETTSITITSPEDERRHNNFISSNSSCEKAAPIVPKSASSVALENYKNTPVQGRTRKISMPTGREITGQMHSTPALHAVPERGAETGKLIKRKSSTQSPSTSSFYYISTPHHGSTLSALHPAHASTLTLNAISNTFTRKGSGRAPKQEEKSGNKFFDCSLLKDPMYLVILISNSTNAVSYTNFVIYLPAYADSLGFDKSMGPLLLSIVSILDLIGRIGGSALSDIKLMPKHWYFVGGLFASGVSLAILPMATTYTLLSVYCGIFGLASGTYVGVTAVIMADMLGTEKLTSSYGISLFVNGILQLIGPPICGMVYQQIDQYGPIFSVLGIILIIGSLLWGFVPFIKKRQKGSEVNSPIDKL